MYLLPLVVTVDTKLGFSVQNTKQYSFCKDLIYANAKASPDLEW